MSAPRMGLHNAARGEAQVHIDGVPKKLCLTLGALAQLEAAFDVVSLEELAQRLQRLSAGDSLIVLAALLSGAGEDIPLAELSRAAIDVQAAARAIDEAFRLAFE